MPEAKLVGKIVCLWIAKVLVKLVSPIVIPVMKVMAVTGYGSNNCLKHGFLPVNVHFYQPIPDIYDLERRKIWDKVSNMRGIRLEPEKGIAFIRQLARKYADECNWPNEPLPDSTQFYLHNGFFSYGCAAPLHCIIREYKPKKIIEIGSGNSSKIITAAINLNMLEKFETNYTIIDPYTRLSEDCLPKNTIIMKQQVELVSLEIFESLGENDILFIDSSHVCKIGSDVNYEILDILPILKKGVLVHFHDIPLPYEYSKVYATNPDFRVFWTESYLLQAFLICNNDFEIMLPMAYLENLYLDQLKEAFPHSSKTDFGWVSGSFWIKRIAEPDDSDPNRQMSS